MKKESDGHPEFIQDETFIKWRLFQTDELDRYWSDYLQKNPEHKKDLLLAIKKFQAIRLNDHDLSPEAQRLTYQNIINRIKKQTTLRRKKIIRYGMAACFALMLISLSVAITYNLRPRESLEPAIMVDTKIGQALPSAKIRLITSDSIVEFDQDAVIKMSKTGQSAIINDETLSKEIPLPSETVNHLIIPAGKRSFVELADGSKIWVNSDTKLQFPTSFKSDSREIHVEGEIYIEVSPIEDQPFFIRTSRFDISVLGTKFNVSTYSDQDNHSVVLVNGSVKIDAGQNINVLHPGDLFNINNNQVQITGGVNTNEYISWKDGILIFNNTPVSEILNKIGRYYNVVFEYDNDLLYSKTCTGKLFLADNLDDVMTSLSALSATIFYRENETIFIKTNKNTMPMK